MTMAMHEELSQLIPTTTTDTQSRNKRSLMLAAAAVGIFGAGAYLGPKIACAIKGIFGGCKSNEQLDKEIEAAVDDLQDAKQEFTRVQSTTNGRFFLIAKQLADITRQQNENTADVNKNFQEMKDRVMTAYVKIRELQDCHDVLRHSMAVTNTYTLLVSLLNNEITYIKSFLAAQHANYQQILASLNDIGRGYLPVAIIPKKHLDMVLDDVERAHNQKGTRLSLALPRTHLMAYYENALVQAAHTTSRGLVLTVSIPMATRSTELHVYRTNTIPMTGTDDYATEWKVDQPYVAVSQDSQQMTLLSQEDMDQCQGHSQFAICTKVFALHKTPNTCTHALFYGTMAEVIRHCPTQHKVLPIQETATNLGRGRWLIQRQHDDYTLVEATQSGRIIRHKGCRACIIQLACGHTINTPHLTIHSDRQSCAIDKSEMMTVTLPDTLSALFQHMPAEFKKMDITEKTAKVQEITDSIHIKVIGNTSFNTDDLIKIATPVIAKYGTHTRRNHSYFAHTTIAPTTFALILTIINAAISGYMTHKYVQFKLKKIPRIAVTSADEYSSSKELNPDPYKKIDKVIVTPTDDRIFKLDQTTTYFTHKTINLKLIN